MPTSGPSAYAIRIHQVLFGGLILLLGLAGVKTMMHGGTGRMLVLVMAIVLASIILALDRHYWVPCLFFMTTGLRFPYVPLDGYEAGVVVLVSVYLVRRALRKERQPALTVDILMAFPVFCWMLIVWMLNPTGLAMFGASSIGARFYFKILCGFSALLVLSSFRFSEKDCKTIFIVVVVASLYSFAANFLSLQVERSAEEALDQEYGSHYEYLGAVLLYILMFSRYGLSQICRSAWRMPATMLFMFLMIYSGKRRAFGTVIVVPLLRVLFTGRDKMITVALGLCGVIMLGLAIAGHGTFYVLPSSAQRALGVIVPSFAKTTGGGTQDTFREGVRRYAQEVIRRSPWFGRRGFAMDRGETAWMVFSKTNDQYAGHAFTGNWHSTWYAFAADFGIPSMIMWALFWLFILVRTYRGFRRNKLGAYAHALYSYYALTLFIAVVFSYTSGQTALTAMSTWITFGMILAIQNGVDETASTGKELTAA